MIRPGQARSRTSSFSPAVPWAKYRSIKGLVSFALSLMVRMAKNSLLSQPAQRGSSGLTLAAERGYDVYSRLIEPHLEAAPGAEIAVTNIEGAGGVIGTKRISEAAGDGRTLGLVNAGGLMGSSSRG